jgi:hypothetical protein
VYFCIRQSDGSAVVINSTHRWSFRNLHSTGFDRGSTAKADLEARLAHLDRLAADLSPKCSIFHADKDQGKERGIIEASLKPAIGSNWNEENHAGGNHNMGGNNTGDTINMNTNNSNSRKKSKSPKSPTSGPNSKSNSKENSKSSIKENSKESNRSNSKASNKGRSKSPKSEKMLFTHLKAEKMVADAATVTRKPHAAAVIGSSSSSHKLGARSPRNHHQEKHTHPSNANPPRTFGQRSTLIPLEISITLSDIIYHTLLNIYESMNHDHDPKSTSDRRGLYLFHDAFLCIIFRVISR